MRACDEEELSWSVEADETVKLLERREADVATDTHMHTYTHKIKGEAKLMWQLTHAHTHACKVPQ